MNKPVTIGTRFAISRIALESSHNKAAFLEMCIEDALRNLASSKQFREQVAATVDVTRIEEHHTLEVEVAKPGTFERAVRDARMAGFDNGFREGQRHAEKEIFNNIRAAYLKDHETYYQQWWETVAKGKGPATTTVPGFPPVSA